MIPLPHTIKSLRESSAIINQKALLENARKVYEYTSVPIMPMLKANGYGHGIVECATVLTDEEYVHSFGVAFVTEAIVLRSQGITNPIVVLMPPTEEMFPYICSYGLQTIAVDIDILTKLNGFAKKRGINIQAHVFIDTGMRRYGVKPENVLEFLHRIKPLSNISIIGICTHFATADNPSSQFFDEQFSTFQQTVNLAESNGFEFPVVHCANSAAIVRTKQSHGNLVRPGLLLYGYHSFAGDVSQLPLQPVLSFATMVSSLRTVPVHTSVGYSQRYITNKMTTIATIPIGYGDGYSRLLEGKSFCLIRGQKFPIVGSICMDACMVDVGDTPVQIGDEVILIGNQGEKQITAEELATSMGTISYEILTNISDRVQRILA